MCSGNFRSRSNGPPGIRRTRKNVVVTTQKRITTKPTVLLAMNWIMVVRRSTFGVQRSGVQRSLFAVHSSHADSPTRFRLILHHGVSRHIWRELFPPSRKCQFDDKKCRADDAADLLDQIHGRARGAAGGQ